MRWQSPDWEPPQVRPGPKGLKEEIAQLRERPGVWALLVEWPVYRSVTHLNRNHPDCEFVTRHKRRPDGTKTTFVFGRAKKEVA